MTSGARVWTTSEAAERVSSGKSTLRRLWLPALVLALGLYAGLPWLAPVFMHLGWTEPARVIYSIYSTQCHQMAQRSFFLFGPKGMYSMAELARVGVSSNPLSLRAFIGSAEMGWKVAWSDRMASMYGSLFVFSLVAVILGGRVRPLPVWATLTMLAPMALDGGTHFLSDLAGLGQGFRDQNAWLATLTGNILPSAFYAGDALGSFNSWMRILTGILFGLGIAWAAVPYFAGVLDPGEGLALPSLAVAGAPPDASSTPTPKQTMLVVPHIRPSIHKPAPGRADRR